MTLTWVICGAGRGVGKTHLALRLCEILPNAVYAKQGCGTRKDDKPANFFKTDAELASFLRTRSDEYEHIVVESNELARQGYGDIVIFVEGTPGRTDYRSDVDLLRSRADLRVGPNANSDRWQHVLHSKGLLAELCAAVRDVLAEPHRRPDGVTRAVCRVEPLRISTEGVAPVCDAGEVVVEELLTIMVEGVGSFAVMCTPCDVEDLAVGFVFAEGLISSIDDVIDCAYHADQHTVGMRLDDPGQQLATRSLIVTSSCGLCGSRNVDKLLEGAMVSGDSLRVPPALLRVVAEEMRARQDLFARTGGTHAAGIFATDGELLAVAEDIGRHNALDKVVGRCLRRGLSLAGRGVMLSGRVSLELVAKAARAGIEIMAAVSAPSSLAIEAAERCNITLCGFVRGERATVYTHRRRIEGPDQ